MLTNILYHKNQISGVYFSLKHIEYPLVSYISGLSMESDNDNRT